MGDGVIRVLYFARRLIRTSERGRRFGTVIIESHLASRCPSVYTGNMRYIGGKRFQRAKLGLLAILVMSVGLIGVQFTVAPAPSSDAADLSQFRPGNIIADALFWDAHAMNVTEIQDFLNARVPTCVAGYTCLKDYRESTRNIPGTPMCSAYAGAPNETAAAIIYKIALACGVSPKVILVTLQKEQGLVTSTKPSPGKFRSAMGAGCPDTAACDANYYGFFNQVHYGSYLLKRYTQPPGTGPGTEWTTRFDLRYPVGQVSQVLYYPNSTCGTKSVFIENQATHALYTYTPYTPNAAALAAGYGIGDGCSTYGNRNFFHFYTDWFGSTQVPQISNLSGGPQILGIQTAGQWVNGWSGELKPAAQTVACVWKRGDNLIAGATDCLYQAQDADVGHQLTVTVTSTRTGYQTLTQSSAPSAPIAATPAAINGLNPLSPSRLADTRSDDSNMTLDRQMQGVGAIAAGQSLRVPVLGRGGVPASGVGAVALNVTATASTSASHLVVYPTGESRPLASNLNFAAKQSIANMVIAKLGADGSISIYNSDGAAHVIVDIAGWFPEGGDYQPLSPTRIADTRSGPLDKTFDGQVEGVGAIKAGGSLSVPIVGRAGVPAAGVSAVALNVTSTASTSNSFLTVYPTGEERPVASNVNFLAGTSVPNMVIAKLGADGSISIYNSDGDAHVIVDIAGWFPEGGEFRPLSPTRITDTRGGAGNVTVDGQMQGVGAVAAGQSLRIPILGRGGVPTDGVGAVVLNVTSTGSTSDSFLSVYPTGENRPQSSSLNFVARQSVANMVIAKIGADGSISIYNSDGATHVIVDIAGWFPDS